jgi:hypothetical protein
MKTLLEKAGASFLRAFGGAVIVLLPGILWATDFSTAKALAISALYAAGAAGLRSVQVFIPALSFDNLVGATYGKFVDAFARVAIAAFVVSIIGILTAPEVSFSKSALQAAVVGAAVAGIRAIQALLTPGETPAPAVGIQA